MTPNDWSRIKAFYRHQIETSLLPFWQRAVDRERGGMFTCFSNDGRQLRSTDKFIWSQGRMVWLWARLAEAMERRWLSGDASRFLAEGEAAARFVERHAILPSGEVAYFVTQEGEPLETIPGAGYAPSFFSDCFVIVGWAELARVTGDRHWYERGLNLWQHLNARLAAGKAPSEPYPVWPGWMQHAQPMVLLNVAETLADAADRLDGGESAGRLRESWRALGSAVWQTFVDGDTVLEMVPATGSDRDTLVGRHVNPGHAIEDMGFILRMAQRAGEPGWVGRAAAGLKRAFELGWDSQYGGILRFVDRDGGPPRGTLGGGRYEALVRDSWDTKLWWPHGETLYATLLASYLTNDTEFDTIYSMTERYVFSVFPNPDPTVGEWIQIRDRAGRPVEQVPALPVKDPFHLLRSFLLIGDLATAAEASPAASPPSR